MKTAIKIPKSRNALDKRIAELKKGGLKTLSDLHEYHTLMIVSIDLELDAIKDSDNPVAKELTERYGKLRDELQSALDRLEQKQFENNFKS